MTATAGPGEPSRPDAVNRAPAATSATAATYADPATARAERSRADHGRCTAMTRAVLRASATPAAHAGATVCRSTHTGRSSDSAGIVSWTTAASAVVATKRWSRRTTDRPPGRATDARSSSMPRIRTVATAAEMLNRPAATYAVRKAELVPSAATASPTRVPAPRPT